MFSPQIGPKTKTTVGSPVHPPPSGNGEWASRGAFLHPYPWRVEMDHRLRPATFSFFFSHFFSIRTVTPPRPRIAYESPLLHAASACPIGENHAESPSRPPRAHSAANRLQPLALAPKSWWPRRRELDGRSPYHTPALNPPTPPNPTGRSKFTGEGPHLDTLSTWVNPAGP